MEGLFGLFAGLILLVLFVFIMRLLGAWMLRINDIISNQKILISEIKKMNGTHHSQSSTDG
jgi:hypothetical protein